MKRWLLFLPAMLFGCPQFAPDDVCGYPGFCDGGTDSGDSGKDASATCPSGKEPKDDPSCVSETLGIFVAPAPTGNDSNAGTKTAPVATLKTALAKVGSKSFIFVCEGSYSESVDIKQSAAIFGGFKCADWSYSPTTLPKFTATKPDYVFHLDGANDTVIGDLELDAMDGAANTGQSSVGTFVANSQNATFERMVIHAAKGADGQDGTLQSLSAQWPDAGEFIGANAVAHDGGAPTPNNNCPGGAGSSVGGNGGNSDGFINGANGTPSLGGGDGGLGGDLNNGCQNGGDGKKGLAGDAGVGASSVGALSVTGWLPTNGGAGATGGVGQGGGGGGGRDNGSAQGGGGGGGAGACGGGGGGGGNGGGGSIAIASFNSTISVKASVIVCATAGKGGNGIAGETGQTPGGLGGNQQNPGCPGGTGGAGGSGGGGGGGAGGVSIGILSKGGSVTVDTATQSSITVANQGGSKGTGASNNDGLDGVAGATLVL
jgi:hypothetical protein